MACKQHVCFLAIFASCLSVVSAECAENELYLIISAGNSDLVVDGNNSSFITAQYFSNSPSQTWRFEGGTKVGYYYIINNHTGKVLDFKTEDSQYQMVLVGKNKRNALRQQWNLRMDGRIQNRENRRNVDIYAAIFLPGTRVIVVPDNGNQAQEFILQKYKEFNLEEWKERQNDK